MTQRNECRVAGYAYLAYIVFAMSAAVLSSRTSAGGDTAAMLTSLSSKMALARVTVLLDLLQTVCAVLLGVTLYRISRGVDATVALIAMCFRLGEGLFGFLPVMAKLELMRLATSSAPCTGACLAVADEIFRRPDDVFSEFCFVVGGFLFAWLLLRGGLIPRWMAWTGVITIGVQTVCVTLSIATVVPGSVVNALWLPILLYEVPLGVWLIAKGVRETPQVVG